MPPKSKKQQQEEAKRLEDERRKKQEEEQALELERKKYASEKHSITGLLLPFTQLFLEEFGGKPLKISEELIRKFLDGAYPTLASLPTDTYQLILEQFYHSLLFVVTQITNKKGENRWEAARAIVGIMFTVLTNECEWFGASGKSKESDYELFSRLVRQHSVNNPKDGKSQLLTIEQAAKLIQFAKTGYFAHHNLLFKWQKFHKREEQQIERIFIDIPARIYNTRSTPWTDLSKKEEPPAQELPPT